VWVKICGLTNEEDALLAVALDADALGFVFAPSTRRLTVDAARDIARRIPPEVLTVGVFRDEPRENVVKAVHRAGLRAAQLHGHESAEDTRWVRERVPVVIKGFAAGTAALEHAADYGPHAVLVDSPSPGSGQVFDWSLAEGAPVRGRVVLAGGLRPDNVAAAIGQVRPWGVDVSSGGEASPGRKDSRKLRTFIANAKAAGASLAERREAAGPADLVPFDWQKE
jgi:phosphoribosylanthranilate isomerase